MGLELWCLMSLSTIYHNGVRVMVFNATFNNISQCYGGLWCLMRLELWCLMSLSTIYHNGVRVMVFNVTFNNISQ